MPAKRPKRTKPKRDEWAAYWMVPCFLILVALIQIYLAKTHFLSPWKGGGFGMFAVTDSPGMRFLTFEALDQQGLPLLIDGKSYLNQQARRFLQSMPTQSQLVKVTEKLQGEIFIPAGSPIVSALSQFNRQNPGIGVADNIDALAEVPLFRVKSPMDPQLPADSEKRLSAIRTKIWRLRFDPVENRLFAEQILETVERGTWPDHP